MNDSSKLTFTHYISKFILKLCVHYLQIQTKAIISFIKLTKTLTKLYDAALNLRPINAVK